MTCPYNSKKRLNSLSSPKSNGLSYDKSNNALKYDNKALKKGMKVESEHSNNKDVQRKIATDHLNENPKYYDKVNLKSKSKEYLVKK